MLSDESANRALAKRLFDSIEAKDVDGTIACFQPTARLWYNTGQPEQGPEFSREAIERTSERVINHQYVNRRVDVFQNGFVQQHVLRGTRKHDGVTLEVPMCVVARVKDGKISRLDTYVDAAQVAEYLSLNLNPS